MSVIAVKPVLSGHSKRRLKIGFQDRLSPNAGQMKGAQWLSGRVLDSRPKGRGFEPHRRHCIVVLEQDTFILA